MSCPGPGPDLSAGVKPICYTAKPTSIWIPNSLRVQLLLPRKAAHLPVKGLMDLLGIDMARMVNAKKIAGVSADKDDLILNPEQIFPPPQIRGRIIAIRIPGNQIVQVFGTANFELRREATRQRMSESSRTSATCSRSCRKRRSADTSPVASPSTSRAVDAKRARATG